MNEGDTWFRVWPADIIARQTQMMHSVSAMYDFVEFGFEL